MSNISFGKEVFEFKNGSESIGMGGPFLGDLYLNDTKIAENVLFENLTVDEKKKRIFLSRYQWVDRTYFFTIVFYELDSGSFYEYEKKFKALFLGQMINDNVLEVYAAFHDKLPDSKSEFDLKNEKFSLAVVGVLPKQVSASAEPTGPIAGFVVILALIAGATLAFFVYCITVCRKAVIKLVRHK